MKRVLLAVFVLAGLVPFVSPAWSASLNDAHDRYLEKRDMNFGQRRESEKKAEERTQERIEENTQEAEVGSEAAESQAQELTEERAESGDEYYDPFEKAYLARQEVV